MKQRWPNLFTEDIEEAVEYGLGEIAMVDERLVEERLDLLETLMGILKDEWEHDMLVGDAGDILRKLGVVS